LHKRYYTTFLEKFNNKHNKTAPQQSGAVVIARLLQGAISCGFTPA